MKKEDKIVKQLIEELKSSDENTVLKALTKIRDKGKTAVLNPMFDLFEQTNNPKIKAEITSILNDIKDSYALEPIVERLRTGSNELNNVLLASLWNSKLNAVDFLPEIVETATRGDYMNALEALTVIENLDGPFLSEKLSEAEFLLQDYLSENTGDKATLLQSLLDIIHEYQANAY